MLKTPATLPSATMLPWTLTRLHLFKLNWYFLRAPFRAAAATNVLRCRLSELKH